MARFLYGFQRPMGRKERSMSKSWLILLGLMLLNNFVSVMLGSVILSIVLDIAVLVIAHFLFKRDMFIDYKQSMIFMAILTSINILDVLNLVQHFVIREGFFALIIWGWFGAQNKFFRYFVIGCVIYNAVQMWQLYKVYNTVDILTTAISVVALLLVSYYDR